MIADWAKQVMVACAKHFSADDYKYKIEEDEVDTSKWSKWAEFRIHGPSVEKLQGTNKITVIINILLSVVNNEVNVYDLHEMAGFYTELFTDIYILELGCLKIQDTVILTYHGKSSDNRITHATLEASYKMLIKE